MNKVTLRASYELVLRRGSRVLTRRAGRNLIVLAGRNQFAEAIAGAETMLLDTISFGDSGAAIDEAQTALQGTLLFETGVGDLVAAPAVRTINGNGVELQVTYTRTDTEPEVTIAEIATFFDDVPPTGPTMMARMLPQAFVMKGGDTLDITWRVQLAGTQVPDAAITYLVSVLDDPTLVSAIDTIRFGASSQAYLASQTTIQGATVIDHTPDSVGAFTNPPRVEATYMNVRVGADLETQEVAALTAAATMLSRRVIPLGFDIHTDDLVSYNWRLYVG